MNIISNCCAGGEFYKRIYKKEYTNPFIWCYMSSNDMCFLIENYEKINYNNFKLLPVENTDYYKIVVDNTISIIYTHYHKSKTAFKTMNVDVYSKDIENYIIEKYKDRLTRMKTLNEQPEFCIITYTKYTYDFYYENVLKIINTLKNTPYKGTIITQFYSLLNYNSENLKIIYNKNVNKTENNFPLFILRENKTELGLTQFSF